MAGPISFQDQVAEVVDVDHDRQEAVEVKCCRVREIFHQIIQQNKILTVVASENGWSMPEVT